MTIRRDGKKLILEPISRKSLLEVLNSLGPIDEDVAEIDDPPIEPEDVF